MHITPFASSLYDGTLSDTYHRLFRDEGEQAVAWLLCALAALLRYSESRPVCPLCPLRSVPFRPYVKLFFLYEHIGKVSESAAASRRRSLMEGSNHSGTYEESM